MEVYTLFFLFSLLQNIDCGYALEPPRQGGSTVYPQSMFSAKKKKTIIFFYCFTTFEINLYITWICFRNVTESETNARRGSASISLACEFLATVLRILSRTFARHSCECRASVVRIFLCRELVANWSRSFQHVQKFYAIFFSKIFCKTVARRSCECLELVAAKFWRIYNAKFLRYSYDCRARVLRKPRDYLARK